MVYSSFIHFENFLNQKHGCILTPIGSIHIMLAPSPCLPPTGCWGCCKALTWSVVIQHTEQIHKQLKFWIHIYCIELHLGNFISTYLEVVWKFLFINMFGLNCCFHTWMTFSMISNIPFANLTLTYTVLTDLVLIWLRRMKKLVDWREGWGFLSVSPVLYI